jgi:NADPH:quinone reductase-like Zn-dependent oxidoreductase
VQEILQATGGHGVDLILDMVGGPYFERNLNVLAQEGRLVQIAFLQGSQVTVNLRQIMTKALTVTGSTLRPRTIAQKAAIASEVYQSVWPLMESTKVKEPVDRVFELKDAGQAHEYMESGAHIGKIILQIA